MWLFGSEQLENEGAVSAYREALREEIRHTKIWVKFPQEKGMLDRTALRGGITDRFIFYMYCVCVCVCTCAQIMTHMSRSENNLGELVLNSHQWFTFHCQTQWQTLFSNAISPAPPTPTPWSFSYTLAQAFKFVSTECAILCKVHVLHIHTHSCVLSSWCLKTPTKVCVLSAL